MKTCIQKLSLLITLCIFLSQISLTFAQQYSLADKKKQLNELQIKIKTLENKLRQSSNKNKFLENELFNTTKQINDYTLRINNIQKNITEKEQQIVLSKKEIADINAKLQQTQKQIAKYIVAEYKALDTTKFKIIVKQKNLSDAETLLFYYNYLLTANKKLLLEFKKTQEILNSKNLRLADELVTLSNLKSKWSNMLNKLQANKKYKVTIIKKLNSDIYKSQKTLSEYRKNQINLSRLISNLTKNSVLQTKNSVMHMQGKLPKPIDVAPSYIKRMNHGLVFYASEGEYVHSVSPGKVVFADWLNGYGLLIILDHGWGVMSLYANNLQLLKRTGEAVISGEKIAKIGHSGILQENGLYFEIRHHGKAMPPEKWLHQ